MQAVETASALKKGEKNLYIIQGDVNYSCSVMLKIIAKVKKDLLICKYDDPSELHSAISSDPEFIGQFRAHIFFGLNSENIEIINECSSMMHPDEILVVTCPRKLSRNRSYTEMVTRSNIVEESVLKDYGSDYDEWVQSLWRNMNITFSLGASSCLLERVGKDRLAILNATKLLLLYSGERKISESEIDSCFPVGALSNFFGFLEDFLTKKVDKVANKIDGSKESECVGFVRAILSEVDKLYKVSVCLGEEMADEKIANQLGINLWVLRNKYKKLNKSIGKAKILNILKVMKEAERKLKQSPLGKRDILKSYCLRSMR